jgi:hypothetical protein
MEGIGRHYVNWSTSSSERQRCFLSYVEDRSKRLMYTQKQAWYIYIYIYIYIYYCYIYI